MFDPLDFDPALAGLWPAGAAAPLPYGSADPAIEAAVRSVWLETKAAAAASPAAELQALLNEMTTEMRQQFEAFRKIRVEAEASLVSGDESALKIAKADIKSANDALSLIVRTIEKIDSLQRSLAHDLETAAEQQFDEAAYAALLAETEREIELRVAERLAIRIRAATEADAAVPTGPPEPG